VQQLGWKLLPLDHPHSPPVRRVRQQRHRRLLQQRLRQWLRLLRQRLRLLQQLLLLTEGTATGAPAQAEALFAYSSLI